jgi:catechol 2,3-dioxygenase-like lactoylglutathione lyase family enzyme
MGKTLFNMGKTLFNMNKLKLKNRNMNRQSFQKRTILTPSRRRIGTQSVFLTIFSLLCTNFANAQRMTVVIPTIKGIHHVSISVQDLDKSVAFYAQAFAMKEASRSRIKSKIKSEKKAGITHIPRKKAVLQSPNAYFELIEFDGAKNQPLSKMPIEGAGITHVCYQMPMAKPIYDKVKTLGATMVSRGDKPVDLGGYGIYYAYTRELNNIMFEMEHFDKPPFSEDVWVGHVSIVTPNIDTLVAFYTQLLGIRPHRRSDSIKPNRKLDDIGGIDSIRLRGAWFKVGNMILEMWEYQNPLTPTPKAVRPFNEIGYQSIAFEVGNIQNEYRRLTGKKMIFLSKPVVQKSDKIVFLRDPDGNLISLQESKIGSAFSFDKLKKLD